MGGDPQNIPQASGDDQIEQLKQQLAQQATPPPQRPSSGVKGLLQNFFQGAGAAMAHHVGLPTDYDRQQKALADLTNVTHYQALEKLQQAEAEQYKPVPLVQLDGKPVTGPDGNPIMLPANHAQTWYAGELAAGARVQAAQINAGPLVNTPQNLQDLGLPAQTTVRTANQAAGLAQKQASQIPVTDEIRSMIPGLPPSVTQLPAASFMRAAVMMAPQTRQSFEWKETSPGVWEPLPTRSVTTRGNVKPGAGGPTSNVAPSRPGMPGKVYGGGSIYAFDPQAQERVLTTPQEQQAKGYTNPTKVTTADIRNDTQLNNRLTDVATKVMRYEEAMKTPISTGIEADTDKISQLLGDDKFKLGAFGMELPVDWMNQLGKRYLTDKLSPAAQKRLVAYYNAREAIQGYQRVLSGSGHASDLGMNLNLTALPSPIAPDSFAREGFAQFKENIPIAGRGLPRMPGIPTAGDILNSKSNGAPASGGGFAAWKAKQKK